MNIWQGIGSLSLLLFGIVVGVVGMSFFPTTETVIETIVTEKVITVEVEKPIITQQIVETVREVEIYRFIDEDQPVHKWVDPDNQAVVYIYPEGYTGQVMPMYAFVPPVWFDQMLGMILHMNDGTMPPAIIKSIPKEWLESVAPGTLPAEQFNSSFNHNH